MKENIFRKSSVERVNSPEQLNEYIRVASPGVWVVLAGIIVFLAGFVVWGVFGKVDTVKNAEVISDGGKLTCYISMQNVEAVNEGMSINVNGLTGTVLSVSPMPVMIPDDADPYLLYIGGYKPGDFAFVAEISVDGLSDGIYEAEIITESINPISFVIQ